MRRLCHTYQGSGTKFYQKENILTVGDYGPTGGTEVGELLEAWKAANEAAGAPGAKEEAADGEEPTLGLYIILDPGHHLGMVRGVKVTR